MKTNNTKKKESQCGCVRMWGVCVSLLCVFITYLIVVIVPKAPNFMIEVHNQSVFDFVKWDL